MRAAFRVAANRPGEWVLPLIGIVALVGCGQGPGAGPGESAESLPILTPHASQPLLRLGDDADASGGFGRIQGAVLLDDTLLVVADAQPPGLAYFSLDGSLFRRAGSPGQGPGEFRSISWIQVDPEGRGVWAYDGSNRRASLFSPVGELLDEVPVPAVEGLNFPQVVGILPHEVLMLRGSPADAPPREPASGRHRFEARVSVAHRDGGEAAHLWEGVATEMGVAVTGTTANPRMVQGPVPLAGELAVCVGPEGRVAIVPHTRAELHMAGREGDGGPDQGLEGWASQVTSWPEDPRPADADLFRQAVADLIGQMGSGNLPPGVEETYLAMDPPETLPVNEGVLCAPDGSFWVGRYPEPGGSAKEWRLLDSHGSQIVQVHLPSNVRPTWVGTERILAVEEDELGVERVLFLEWRSP
ncbi:MAG: hypothetical protein WEA09_03655 [Gemmatimonadota bacterium]